MSVNHNRYLVIRELDPDKLAQMVEIKMREGWSCQGGVSAQTVQNSTYLTQAMTRYERWFARDDGGSSQ